MSVLIAVPFFACRGKKFLRLSRKHPRLELEGAPFSINIYHKGPLCPYANPLGPGLGFPVSLVCLTLPGRESRVARVRPFLDAGGNLSASVAVSLGASEVKPRQAGAVNLGDPSVDGMGGRKNQMEPAPAFLGPLDKNLRNSQMARDFHNFPKWKLNK